MYKIGGFYVEIFSEYNHIVNRAEKYRVEYSGTPDFQLTPNRHAKVDPTVYPDKNIMEYCLLGDNFAEKVLCFNAVVIHASAICVDNSAFLFSAVGGTGKSTHTGFWRDMLSKKKVDYINDDKPLLRIKDNNVLTYGTPFSGKTDRNSNICVPLKAICFLKQDKKNWIGRLSERSAFTKFVAQTLRGLPRNMRTELEETVHIIVNKIPMYEMGCKAEIAAANISYQVMSGMHELEIGEIYEE